MEAGETQRVARRYNEQIMEYVDPVTAAHQAIREVWPGLLQRPARYATYDHMQRTFAAELIRLARRGKR